MPHLYIRALSAFSISRINSKWASRFNCDSATLTITWIILTLANEIYMICFKASVARKFLGRRTFLKVRIEKNRRGTSISKNRHARHIHADQVKSNERHLRLNGRKLKKLQTARGIEIECTNIFHFYSFDQQRRTDCWATSRLKLFSNAEGFLLLAFIFNELLWALNPDFDPTNLESKTLDVSAIHVFQK